jgi:competence protein ComEA
MVSKKFIFALCCSVGVALPLAVSAQLPTTTTPVAPAAPGMKMPSSGGGMSPGGMSGPKAQDLTTPGTSGGTTAPGTGGGTPAPGTGGGTPAPMDAPAPASTGAPAPDAMPKPIPKKAPSSTTPKKPGKSTTAMVNVNSATMQELTKVKGIGAATAKKIMTNRPYATLEDLVTKKALTKTQFTSLKSQLEL